MRTIGRKVDFKNKKINDREIMMRVMSETSFDRILNVDDQSDKTLQEAFIIGSVMILEVRYFKSLISANPNQNKVMREFKEGIERIDRIYGKKITGIMAELSVEAAGKGHDLNGMNDADIIEGVLERIKYKDDKDIVWIAFDIGKIISYVEMQDRLKKVYDKG